MTGNNDGGEGPPPLDNVRKLPVRPQTQDQERAASERNRFAMAMARIDHLAHQRSAPLRARLHHVLSQKPEIYRQIKDSRQSPDSRLWVTETSAGGTGIPALQEFFRGVAPEDRMLTMEMLQTWLFRNFGHLRPRYPQVFGEGYEGTDEFTEHVFISWSDPPPDGEPEPDPPLMA
jgi:hypothetical protein